MCRIEYSCEACDILKQQLEIANRYNQQLLDRLTKPAEETRVVIPDLKPVGGYEPFHIRRARLEAESRIKAGLKEQFQKAEELIVKAPKSIEELENELDLEKEIS